MGPWISISHAHRMPIEYPRGTLCLDTKSALHISNMYKHSQSVQGGTQEQTDTLCPTKKRVRISAFDTDKINKTQNFPDTVLLIALMVCHFLQKNVLFLCVIIFEILLKTYRHIFATLYPKNMGLHIVSRHNDCVVLFLYPRAFFLFPVLCDTV